MTHGFGQRPQAAWTAITRMLQALVAGPCTIADLVEETGLAESTLRGYIAELRRTDPKLVVIGARMLAPNNQPSIHAYKWEPGGKDCKVKRTPAHIRSRNYRKRKKDAARNAALGTDIRTPHPDSANCAGCKGKGYRLVQRGGAEYPVQCEGCTPPLIPHRPNWPNDLEAA